MNAQFNLKIPDDLLERAKRLAEKKGVSLAKLIKDWLEENVEPEKTRLDKFEERLKEFEKRLTEIEQKDK